MLVVYGSTHDIPFMLKIFTNLHSYIWRENVSPKDFKDQASMERGKVILAYMSASIHRGEAIE
jgi:hypothetical protein